MYNTNYDSGNVVNWFDAVDYLGISAYYDVADRPGSSEEEMFSKWLEHRDGIKAMSEKWDKPVLFAEVGCRSAEGCAMMPYDYLHDEFPYSEEEQANFYASCLRAFYHEPWFCGFFWWHWSINPDDESAKMGFDIYGKKAEGVLRKWYDK
jgi:hypothetical protein